MSVKLSVIFITYNHAEYVEKALRSVLSQKTDFDYEVVLFDDASTDGTQDIVRRVSAEYPIKVTLNLLKTNSGHPTKNVYDASMMCEGEYLAYLEGDDYWSDEHKLQRQVDFLDNHPEYVATTHAIKMIDGGGNAITDSESLAVGSLYDWSGKFTYNDFRESGKWAGHYSTVVSRNIYKYGEKYDYSILYRASKFTDDALILLFLLMQGDIYRMDDAMSCWRYIRKEGGTNWNSLVINNNLFRDNAYLSKTMMKWMEEQKGLGEYSVKKCKDDFGLALRCYIKKPNDENKKFLEDMYDYGITHVVLKDKKSSLFAYSLKFIWNRLLGK